jgi:hypothetical protein
MDYSSNFFGKKINDLSYADIESFFTEDQEENNLIEFKSFDSIHGNINESLDGVKRCICAMLNSDGGIIILGAPKGRKVDNKKEKVFKGVLCPVHQLIEKDRLINTISGSIIPLPVSVKVNILQNEGNYVYAFEVQKSEYSPHQFKNCYYARLDGQTQPAPHYLVEALFRKISYPNIKGYIGLNNIDINGNNYLLNISIYMFNVSELQNEEDVSYSLMCDCGIFANSRSPVLAPMYSHEGHRLIHLGLIKVLSYGQVDRHDEVIIINPYEISRNEHKLNLFLDFGGKKSPRKSSDYILDLNKMDLNNKDNPNYLFDKMDENILMSEKRTDLTSEQKISNVLGREVRI